MAKKKSTGKKAAKKKEKLRPAQWLCVMKNGEGQFAESVVVTASTAKEALGFGEFIANQIQARLGENDVISLDGVQPM